ncbi:MAG TPA: 23S rRNA (guanosine(2251)-2'-O)-methyltransferase RlmB [Gammaproteobacteria bacterium]|jgi:23S rRNA (guanosine2251-2'-O)-methyltransferase|nr:23S rRNA (guanosine(2251)-2'-O)-methyltransferase RlmB [Gammaproteobacteria bacterium]
MIVFGLHATLSLLETHSERVLRLYVLRDRRDQKIEKIIKIAENKHIVIELVSRSVLDNMAQDGNHQGVVAECAAMKTYGESDIKQLLDTIEGPPFLLILDGVQDPHNLGACFRTAEAAGVHAIIVPKDKSVGITSTVIKVASGATEVVPFFQVTNLARTLEMLKEKGVWIYGAAGEASDLLYEANLTGAVAIVLGGEGEGLRRLTRERCDALLRIPMHGSVASLNVSVATGVFLYEVVRQNKR